MTQPQSLPALFMMWFVVKSCGRIAWGKRSCATRQMQGGNECGYGNGNGCEQLHGCSSVN